MTDLSERIKTAAEKIALEKGQPHSTWFCFKDEAYERIHSEDFAALSAVGRPSDLSPFRQAQYDAYGAALSVPCLQEPDKVDRMIDFILSDESPVTEVDQNDVDMFNAAVEKGKRRIAASKIVAYASSSEFRKNQLISAAQYNSALPKNRIEFDIPLYAQPIEVREQAIREWHPISTVKTGDDNASQD
ncbi:hypothetical protein BFS86_19735 [Shewanella algae]|jgi:hypothetical protein|nr:hypothetical protein BFS86_19735 [Shewanella algae]